MRTRDWAGVRLTVAEVCISLGLGSTVVMGAYWLGDMVGGGHSLTLEIRASSTPMRQSQPASKQI